MSRPIEEKQNCFNPADSQYFNTLPAFVQESLMQSAGLITDEQSLREAAENLMNGQQL